jgi:hypothetical protein
MVYSKHQKINYVPGWVSKKNSVECCFIVRLRREMPLDQPKIPVVLQFGLALSLRASNFEVGLKQPSFQFMGCVRLIDYGLKVTRFKQRI